MGKNVSRYKRNLISNVQFDKNSDKIFVMKIKIVAIVILFCFLVTTSSYALYGTRPMGMGGAFTAVADDANAAYWNPAGLAINPGVDLYGSSLISNRNETIGDNLASLKMCYEAEINPFTWILGVGGVTLLALSVAKYLGDQGILKKNWDRKKESSSKEESVSEKVLESGTEESVAVGSKVKEKVSDMGEALLENTTSAVKSIGKAFIQGIGAESGRNVYWGPMNYPWYHRNYSRPTYWDNREDKKDFSPQGRAQFAAGISVITDKNSTANQNTNYYTLSLATGYEERVALGGNINIYDITIPSPSNIKGYGAGIDLGLIIKPAEQLSLGVTAKEVLTTDVYFQNGAIIRFPMTINAGVAITPIEELTLSGDIHNLLNQNAATQTQRFGVEARPFPGLALRAGLFDQSKTAGASIMIGSVIIDYAYLGGTFIGCKGSSIGCVPIAIGKTSFAFR